MKRLVFKKIYLSALFLTLLFAGCGGGEDAAEPVLIGVPVLISAPAQTSAAQVTVRIGGAAGLEVLVNGVSAGTMPASQELDLVLSTSGADGPKRFSIVFRDPQGDVGGALVVEIEKISTQNGGAYALTITSSSTIGGFEVTLGFAQDVNSSELTVGAISMAAAHLLGPRALDPQTLTFGAYSDSGTATSVSTPLNFHRALKAELFDWLVVDPQGTPISADVVLKPQE